MALIEPNRTTDSLLDPSHSGLVSCVYVGLCAAAFVLLASVLGESNWDMLGYIASIKIFSYPDAEALHALVYSQARAELPAHHYADLIGRDSYRQVMASNPELFQVQVPYYQIRVIFLTLVSAVESLGVSIITAGHLVSACASGLAAFLFYPALKSRVAPALWLLFPAVFILVGALDSARQFSPDSLAFLVFSALFLSYLKRHWSFYLVFVLAVGVRTDLIVLLVFCTLYAWLMEPEHRLRISLAFVIAFVLYKTINTVTGNYGWAASHYHVFETGMQATDPRQFSDHVVTLQSYFRAIVVNAYKIAFHPELWVALMSAFVSALVFMKGGEWQGGRSIWATIQGAFRSEPLLAPWLISLMYIAAHYVMFPLLETRFFVGCYAILVFTFLAVLSRQLRNPSAISEG